MKILIITNLFPPHVLGGYEILCHQVCERLSAHGHELSVLTSDHGCAQGEEGFSADYPVSRVLKLYEPFATNPGGQGSIPRKQRKRQRIVARENGLETTAAIDTFAPDIIFIWSQLRLTLGSTRAARRSGLPVLYTFNDMHPTGMVSAPWEWSLRGIYRYLADNIAFPEISWRGLFPIHSTCISEQLKRDMIAAGMRIENSEVIYQGIPVEKFPLKENPGSLSDPVRVLYTGQLHDYKGVHTLLDAIGLLEKRSGLPEFELSLIGEGPESYKQKLRSQIAELKTSVTMMGRLPHQELPAQYRSHDLFVFPSEWPEPFGLTHLEAMGSGLPVISTTSGGHGEFLVDQENCLAFEKANASELAACLERLMTEPELALRLAQAGRQVVEQTLNIDAYVMRLEELLERLARHA